MIKHFEFLTHFSMVYSESFNIGHLTLFGYDYVSVHHDKAYTWMLLKASHQLTSDFYM